MSRSKPKDEAERLVRVIVFESGTSAELWVDEQNILQFANPETAETRANIIRNAIRKVIEGRDRILTDMLSESEAFHEGWRQGAAAQRKADCEKLDDCDWHEPQKYLDRELMRPPSHDTNGEPLTPSAVHLRAQRLELTLKTITKIQINHTIDFTPLLTQIAREALEELTNE